MSGRLRDLIRAVRNCKTAADERAVVQRESALIRQQLSGGQNRGPNMLKLMYMAMLGYATEFGQLEVVKLLAEHDFASKRVGYLALCVLLDESQEVLTLAENHIKRDLVATDKPFITCLALDAVANIAGEDMSRDMMNEIYNLLGSSNTHVRKKAALAAQRAVRKAPELVDVFLEDERLMSILNERNHGVLVCFLSLINECLSAPTGTSYVSKYQALIPAAVRQLNGLVLSGYAMEHEVAGIADPFLQVKLLEFLRLVGRGSDAASEAMNNVLAQTATNTVSERNVGCAVLYECVRTILAINSDESLRVLAYNILGRFMDRDNNCRFVALSMFSEVVRVDHGVAARHRATVIDCLRDVDLSIRKRALQLTAALVDDTNVRLMASDLLAYLGVCAVEMREDTTEQLCRVIEKQSPNTEWRIEMSLKLFKAPAARIPESFAEHFIAAVTRSDDDIKTRAATALWDEFRAVSADPTSHLGRQGLLLAATWLCGEFCQKIAPSVAPADVVLGTVGAIATDGPTTLARQYGLNAVVKIAARFSQLHELALGVFDMCASSMDCEISQRAAEYGVMVREFGGELLTFAFSEGGAIAAEVDDTDELNLPATPLAPSERSAPTANTNVPVGKAPEAFDMASIFGGGGPPKPGPTSSTASVAGTTATGASPATSNNPWDDIFGGTPIGASPSAPLPPSSSTSSIPTSAAAAARAGPQAHGADDIFGAPTSSAAPASPPTQAPRGPPRITVHDSADVRIEVSAEAVGGSSSTPVHFFVHAKQKSLSNIVLLIAVTKTCSLELMPAQQDACAAGGFVDHKMTVHSSAGPLQKLAMKVKLTYNANGAAGVSEFQFSEPLPFARG